MKKPIIQIFIAILILIACFKLGEMKGHWDIAKEINNIRKANNGIHALINDFNHLRGNK